MPTPHRRLNRSALNGSQRGHQQAIACKRLNRLRRFVIAHPAFPTTDVPPPTP